MSYISIIYIFRTKYDHHEKDGGEVGVYKPQEFIIHNTVIVQYILHLGDQFPFFLVFDIKKTENGGPKPIEHNTKFSTLQCRSLTSCFEIDCAQNEIIEASTVFAFEFMSPVLLIYK
jgi:hypothetical protein